MILLALLAAAPPLPDLPAPLGRLDSVLERPLGGAPSDERIVDITLPKCEAKVPANLNRFASSTMFAFQQLVEWMRQVPGLEAELFKDGVLQEVTAGFSGSKISEQKACKALPQDVAAAPKLCPGFADDHGWFMLDEKTPAVLVRWGPSKSPSKCLPTLTGVMFDAKGTARVRYVADFGGAATAELRGDKCQVTFTFDADKQVFHAKRVGCKG